MVKLVGIKRMLLCEDDGDLRSTIMEHFARKGYTIYPAENANEGAKAYIRAIRDKEKMDIIVTDIEMPVPMTSFRRTYTGIDMVRGLERQFGKAITDARVIYMASDINGYLKHIQPYAQWIVKPFKMSELEEVVKHGAQAGNDHR